MKAFIVDRYGKKGALRFGDMPEPALGDDDVLVEVHAAGLNLLDSKIRDGEFKAILPYRPPFILGHDVAGTVVRVGSNVRRFKPGDEVYARPRDGRIGTFAEFIAIERGRRGAEAQEPQHGGGGFDPPGRPDRLAGAGRASRAGEGAEDPHPRRFRRRGDIRHPIGEASRRDRRDHDERGECRSGQKPRRRCRHRLQKPGLRKGAVRL